MAICICIHIYTYAYIPSISPRSRLDLASTSQDAADGSLDGKRDLKKLREQDTDIDAGERDEIDDDEIDAAVSPRGPRNI